MTGNNWVIVVYVLDDANAECSFDKNKTIVLSCKHHQNRDRKSKKKERKNQRNKTTTTTTTQFIMLRQSWNHDLKNKKKSEGQRDTQREQKRIERVACILMKSNSVTAD